MRWSWESAEFCGSAVHLWKIQAGRLRTQHIWWIWAWALFRLLLSYSRGVWDWVYLSFRFLIVNEDLIRDLVCEPLSTGYKTYYGVLQTAEDISCWNYHYIFSVTKLNPIPLLLFSCWIVSGSLQPHGLRHARLPCPSLSPRFCSNSSSLSRWCHPTISSFVVPFSCPQSFLTSGSFPMSCSLHY